MSQVPGSPIITAKRQKLMRTRKMRNVNTEIAINYDSISILETLYENPSGKFHSH